MVLFPSSKNSFVVSVLWLLVGICSSDTIGSNLYRDVDDVVGVNQVCFIL